MNNEPFFPIGWYTGYIPSSTATATTYLATMQYNGFNTGLTCYYTWRGDYLTYMKRVLDGAAANDMPMMVEIIRCAVEGGCLLSKIDQQVDALKSYPALLGWYMIDQPEYKDLTPEDLIPIYQQIKNRDTVGHPVFIEFGSWDTHRPEDEYLAAGTLSDALMTNIYPTRNTEIEFAGKLWRPAVTARHGTQVAVMYNQEAYINVVQAHQWESGLRLPTFPEQRYISYAPIVEGARGLYYWMYELGATEGQRNILIPKIVHEIQSLVPAVISNSTAVSVTSNRDTDTTGHGIEDVTYLFAADGRRGYLVAVNNTPNQFAVTFQLSGSMLASVFGSQSQAIPVLFEQRNVQVEPTGDPSVRTLVDNCSPFDVNIYLIYDIPNSGTPTGLPAKASAPHPINQATSVGRNFNLTWTSDQQATSYNIYFGTTNPPPYQDNKTGTVFNPGTMLYNKIYYWHIDTVNSYGTTTGDLWTFTTADRYLPEQATNPYPNHLAVNVDRSDDLAWAIAPAARSYNVYFGATNPPPFCGNQAEVAFDTGTMTANTAYYWRIDPVNDDGTTTGQLWQFTTGQTIGAGVMADPPPGSILTSDTVTFTWNAGASSIAYWLYIGSSKGGSDLFSDDLWNGITHANVTGLPTDGRTLYVRLKSRTDTEWRWFNDYIYTAATIILPDPATDPIPQDQATKVWPGVKLSWSPGNNTDSFNIYFGTADPPAYLANLTQTTFDPGDMVPSTPYYWRIDSVNANGITTGQAWTFTTRDWQTSIDLGTTDDEQGLKRVVVGDGDTQPVNIGDRDARRNVDPATDYYFYFNADDLYVYQGSRPDLYVTIDYYNTGSGSLGLQYDSSDNAPFPNDIYKNGGIVDLTGSNEWKQYFFHVTDVYFSNRQNGGADFRIAKYNGGFIYLDKVEVVEESPLPAQPAGPNPPHLATQVSTTASLSWTAAARATSYNVYFGMTYPLMFQGNQIQTTFDPGTLNRQTAYFWRIDAVNGFGVTEGAGWSFTTKPYPGDFDEDRDVDQEDFGHLQACFSGDTRPYELGCDDADLHTDGDVDQDDFIVFKSCMSGANQTPGCP
ncbi:MAG: fibronectin type III domain-containing protein [Planctomycetota bacterium]